MSPTRMCRVAIATAFVVAGCAEKSTTGLPAPDYSPVNLDFAFPDATRESLALTERVVHEPSSRPAGLLTQDPDPPPVEPVSEIHSASTEVGFGPNYAYSRGRQTYSGNVGKIETEVTVTFDGQLIGTRPASREESVPYLFDFGEIKQLWAEAYVFIDQDCGLRVDGQSSHYASWQWFVGSSAPTWGAAGLTTQAFPPYSQPECQDAPDDYYSGESDSGGGSGPVGCWYWVTYDLETGEIVDAELLYCDDMIGG